MNLVVVGQGYVGLPLAQRAVEAGLSVVGLDANSKVVRELNEGRSHVDDIPSSAVASMLSADYRASDDFVVVQQADVVVICVPTPLSADGSPDLNAVRLVCEGVGANLREGTLVVLESTTYPGTTDDVVRPILEGYGHVIDRDFHLAFSPERIDPGNKVYGIKNTPKIVGGVTTASTDAAQRFYAQLVDSVVVVSGAKEAETAKLLENTYRHVNIALVNEMARLCHELGIDIWSVIRAASTKPFGFQPFYPGPGVGGHCIPIDPNYLSYEVKRKLGRPFRFVELAQEINDSMPTYVVDRVQDALNDQEKPLRGSTVLLLGVSYKANIADSRESPAEPIAVALQGKGARVIYHDPRVAVWNAGSVSMSSEADLTRSVLEADITVLLQANQEYDVDRLAEQATLFFDTRGVSTSDAAILL